MTFEKRSEESNRAGHTVPRLKDDSDRREIVKVPRRSRRTHGWRGLIGCGWGEGEGAEHVDHCRHVILNQYKFWQNLQILVISEDIFSCRNLQRRRRY